jgi:2-polyprenyl-6-methoxyphenol hydroxylase-like FAD-dependent oxidoreductase
MIDPKFLYTPINLFLLGHVYTLRDYARSRQLEVLPIMTAIGGLQKLFTTDQYLVASLRSVGLRYFDSLPILKVRYYYNVDY